MEVVFEETEATCDNFRHKGRKWGPPMSDATPIRKPPWERGVSLTKRNRVHLVAAVGYLTNKVGGWYVGFESCAANSLLSRGN